MDKRGIHGTSEKKKKNQEFIQMPRKKKYVYFRLINNTLSSFSGSCCEKDQGAQGGTH